MALLQNGDDPPKGDNEPIPPGQQPQKTVGPTLQGGKLAPSLPPLQDGDIAPSSLNPPLQGGHQDPSTVVAATLTFPNCGHVIGGDLYRDFLTRRDPDCPVCQQGPFGGFLEFGSCGHTIFGDALRRVLVSCNNQCPVCIPFSDEDGATDTNSDPTSPTPTDVYTERSRVTLNKYQDPFTFEGVTGEIFLNKYGRARLRVMEEEWNTWSKKKKDFFTYCTNVRLEHYVGESQQSQQAPTNPGNPNHPDYTPTSTVSVLRRRHRRKHEPEKVAAAIRRLLATPDEDVVPGQPYLHAQTAAPPTINQPTHEEEGNAVDVINDQPQELATTDGDGKKGVRRPTFMDRVREQAQKFVGTWGYVLPYLPLFPSTSTEPVASEDSAVGVLVLESHGFVSSEAAVNEGNRYISH